MAVVDLELVGEVLEIVVVGSAVDSVVVDLVSAAVGLAPTAAEVEVMVEAKQPRSLVKPEAVIQ